MSIGAKWIVGGVVAIAVLLGDVLLSKAVFHYLCAGQGGQQVLATADRVEGLLLAGPGGIGCAGVCMELLGKKRYKYIEVEVDLSKPEYLTSSNGLYRFSLAASGAQECVAYQALAARSVGVAEHYERVFGIPRASCIAAIRVPAPAASHRYERDRDAGYVGVLGIARVTETLSDLRTGARLATSTAFSRMNGWLLAASGLHPGPHQTCQPFERWVIDRIETILKPA
jgi:hypothetical protein